MRRLHIYPWPASSTTSNGARRTLLSVRSSIVSALMSGTVRSDDSKTVTMTLIFARFYVDLDTMPASSAYSIAQTDLRTHASGSTSNPPSPKSSSICTKSLKMLGSSLKLGGTECIAVRRKRHCEEAATVYILAAIHKWRHAIHSVYRHLYARELACLRGTGQ